MKNHKAFTFIELMVVIAVLATIIAFLLPVSVKARRIASISQCAHNLAQIGLACQLYSDDYRGLLPPRIGEGSIEYKDALWTLLPADPVAQPEDPVWAHDLAPLKAASNIAARRVWGFGVLYRGGYVKDYSIFFCPTELDGKYGLDGFATPYLKDSHDFYASSYHFNPHWARATPGDRNTPMVTAYSRIGAYPRTEALALDLIRDQFNVAHVRTADGDGSWNLLFSDGHVALTASKLVYASLENQPVGGGWRRFDDYLDMLETVADGHDPEEHPPTYRAHPRADYALPVKAARGARNN